MAPWSLASCRSVELYNCRYVHSKDAVKKYCSLREAAIIIQHKYGGITTARWRRQDDPPRDDGWLLVSRCHPPSFQCQDSFERGPNMVCLVCYWSQHFLCSSLSQKASMFSTHWGLKMDPNMSGASVGPGLDLDTCIEMTLWDYALWGYPHTCEICVKE